ncbi:MAG: tetrahydrodipicolinate N-succinyltransferase N-terminal domain-containing protein [Candidatus Pacebacteria bacterium]|nr:tetrahydrodipicolinate N-succinyltransferase N-terminal domain-containing protein [Candidatus Paceibacterota bacterium]
MTTITTIEEFNNFSKRFKAEHVMPYAFGIGICFEDEKGEPIAHKWLTVNVNENLGTAAVLMDSTGIEMEGNHPQYYKMHPVIPIDIEKYFSPFENDGKYHENIEVLKYNQLTNYDNARLVLILYPDKEFFQKIVISNADAHFRLAAISRLKFKPNTICLDNLFKVLPNIAYLSDGGACSIDYWNKEEFIGGNLQVRSLIDKIPLLTWGAPIPPEVRIANPDNVRLGAYLSPGTTIMHYGFVNFNAGTLGKSMVEGRISAGTTIDDGTDIGAGAGFLGTLSGGNSIKLSAGKDCLIGAMAECGVILGNNCVVATGTCFSQNTPIWEIYPDGNAAWKKVKDLNGKDNLTFRRNAVNGRLEVIHKGNKAILNEELHKN